MSERPQPRDRTATPRPPGPGRSPGKHRSRQGFFHRHTKRVVVSIAGFGLVIVGVVLAMPLVPGPGGLVIIAGLALLATEFDWAERWLHRARDRWADAARRVGVDPKAATAGAIIVVVVITGVALWLTFR